MRKQHIKLIILFLAFVVVFSFCSIIILEAASSEKSHLSKINNEVWGNEPEENVISADTTEENNEATTCEEVWIYPTENNEENKTLVKRSDGKELIYIRFNTIPREEVDEKFKDIYGFDYCMYLDEKRLKEEAIPLILGREYEEGDEFNELVIEKK